METLKGLKRTHYCGDLRLEDQGKEVILMGWANKTRDLGALSFIDLRDKTGISQLVFNKEENEALYNKSKEVHQEYVLAARGVVRERSSKNPDLSTGEVEVECSELRILDVAKTPPIYIKDDDNASEEIRLKYRYLDLRKPRMQEMLTKRAEI
ncbi:MAG: OB-fold nucleic acid binding domain-containing protein, partial [Firmicutes bacterium]|nr:OB-fold nucleic acid binding domain-containing protein [Bacillota bacterium]